MFINSRLNCLGLLVAFIFSGCQSPSNRWATASKERTNPKSKVRGDKEDLDSRPSKSGKNTEPLARVPGSNNESRSRKSDSTKDSLQLSEWIEKGDRLRKSGQIEDARLAYNSARSLAPENPEVNHRLAIIADKQQQYSVADQHYQTALRAKPRDVNLLSDLGYSYSLRGSNLQAEQTLKQALAIDPTHRGAMANLGAIYAQQNRYPEALAMFRKGSTSESEAQQNIAKLFPEKSAVASSEHRSFDEDSMMTSSRPGSEPDLGKLSLQQLQAELSRREQSGKSATPREASWDSHDSEPVESQPQSTASINSDRDPKSGNARSGSPRGAVDDQIMQVRGQSNVEPTESRFQNSGRSSASRVAARVGMNTGPGNLFPILALSNPSNAPFESDPGPGSADSHIGSSESAFPQSAKTATVPNGPISGGNSGRPSDPLPKATFQEGGFDSLRSATPAQEPAANRTASWRDGLQNSISWDSDVQNAGMTQPTFGAVDPGQIGSGQSQTTQADKVSTVRSATNSFAGVRNGNESSRPYNGAWPNSNSIPARVNQQKTSTNDPSTDGFDALSVDLRRGDTSTNPRYGNGATTVLPTSSPAKWPDAPNR